ncbi:type VI secretion system Vgr family protein [Pseudomonas sp. S9]|uniref:type VI secretion system Vgr family protein n=1 Tax=Pseudomonas sp. S9 TaxID=686578 RepID=UPI0002556AD9|nr:type VI secretion system tip protein VgrG [Pseudomonas sp. S9]
MFNPANETHFSLNIKDQPHDLQVLNFTGVERISQPYLFQVEVVSEQPDIDLESLLGKAVFLAFTPQGAGIHGIIQSFAQRESGKRLTRYQLNIAPQLSYLARRTNQRIFQALNVPQIISTVLEEHGILSNSYQFQLGPTVYPPRDYCVQYDETDLHFIQRLCEEEGIHYHFQHSPDAHMLVFGDDQSVFPKLGQPTVYLPGSGMVANEPAIRRFAMRQHTRSSRVTQRDYNFETPRLLLEAAYKQPQEQDAKALPDLEDYSYPGHFSERERGKHLSQRALERHRSDYRLAEGKSDQPALISGHFLEISDHPRSEWNDLWLIHQVHHEGKQPQVLEESMTHDTGDTDDFQQGYRNSFVATPWDIPYRPTLLHPKPQVLGSQTAVVTGPAGEEIHCDQYGRIKVQFHWDREGSGDDKSSCWLRVASNWAGDLYGGIAIPRVGMEVVVTFLEADPDQPLVTGCLYHAENNVPYALPANKTRSTFKTLSSPGGAGYNEVRLEDKKGEEQKFIHAQRDLAENIEHEQKIHIGNERHDTVEANSFSEFKAEEHITVTSDRKVETKANDHLSIGVSQHTQLGTAQLTKAGREIHLKAGQKMVIEAGVELTLQAGGSFIKLDPSGISMVGPIIRYNAGGAPGKGTGIAALLPAIPLPADMDKAGELLKNATPGTLQPRDQIEPRDYVFNIELRDVPGEDGFPLAFTPWRILQTGKEQALLQGQTNEQGQIVLDSDQQTTLSKAYASASQSLFLAYPGQQVSLRLFLEQPQWDSEHHALSALDFNDCVSPNRGTPSLLDHERSKQDTACTTDFYTHLQSKG